MSSLQSHLPVDEIMRALATVTYAPMITVMAQYDRPIAQPSDSLPNPAGEAWAIEGHPDTCLFWAGLDSSKRSVAGTNIVLHSSPAFARQWLETSDLQPAGETLLQQASALIGRWLSRPVRWQVHRWRYALVEKTAVNSPLSMTEPLPLVACGDWCGTAHLDTALEAGWSAAERLPVAFGKTPLAPLPNDLMAIVSAPESR